MIEIGWKRDNNNFRFWLNSKKFDECRWKDKTEQTSYSIAGLRYLSTFSVRWFMTWWGVQPLPPYFCCVCGTRLVSSSPLSIFIHLLFSFCVCFYLFRCFYYSLWTCWAVVVWLIHLLLDGSSKKIATTTTDYQRKRKNLFLYHLSISTRIFFSFLKKVKRKENAPSFYHDYLESISIDTKKKLETYIL